MPRKAANPRAPDRQHGSWHGDRQCNSTESLAAAWSAENALATDTDTEHGSWHRAGTGNVTGSTACYAQNARARDIDYGSSHGDGEGNSTGSAACNAWNTWDPHIDYGSWHGYAEGNIRNGADWNAERGACAPDNECGSWHNDGTGIITGHAAWNAQNACAPAIDYGSSHGSWPDDGASRGEGLDYTSQAWHCPDSDEDALFPSVEAGQAMCLTKRLVDAGFVWPPAAQPDTFPIEFTFPLRCPICSVHCKSLRVVKWHRNGRSHTVNSLALLYANAYKACYGQAPS